MIPITESVIIPETCARPTLQRMVRAAEKHMFDLKAQLAKMTAPPVVSGGVIRLDAPSEYRCQRCGRTSCEFHNRDYQHVVIIWNFTTRNGCLSWLPEEL